MSDPRLRGLCAITPQDPIQARLSAIVTLALEGGVRHVQYRNKNSPPPLRRAEAADLLRICRAYDALLIINDDVALAADIGADGVHIGREDGPIANARALLGPGAIIGVTCYNDIKNAEAAVGEGADYIAFGAVFPSSIKPEAVHAPLSLIAEAKRRFKVPVCAIGGITTQNLHELLAVGVDMAAVITDLFDAEDITVQAREYQRQFGL